MQTDTGSIKLPVQTLSDLGISKRLVHSSKGVESISSKGYVSYSQCLHKKGDSSHLTQPLTRSLPCVTFNSSFIAVNVMGEEKGL